MQQYAATCSNTNYGIVSFVQFVFVWIPVPDCWLYLADGAAVDQRPTGGVRRLSLCYANLRHIFLGFLRASMGERSVWNWTLLVRALWFMIFMVCAAYSSKISKTFSKCIFWTPVCFFVDILYVSNSPRLNLTSAWCALITLAALFLSRIYGLSSSLRWFPGTELTELMAWEICWRWQNPNEKNPISLMRFLGLSPGAMDSAWFCLCGEANIENWYITDIEKIIQELKFAKIHENRPNSSPSPLSPLIYLRAWSIHSQGFNVPIFKDRRDERIPRILCISRISPIFWPWHTWCHFSPGGVAVESSRPSCTCFTWWSLRFCGAESKGPWVVLAFLPFFHLPVPSDPNDPNDPSLETCLGFPGFHSWTSSWSLSKKSGSQWWDYYYSNRLALRELIIVFFFFE